MNAHRSLRRHVAEHLGAAWDVGLADEEGAYVRPFAVVHAATPLTIGDRGPAFAERRQSFAVVAYPTSFPATMEAEITEANRVADLLFGALVSRRIPLFDYTGVQSGEAATEQIGHLRVIDPPTIDAFADRDDQRAWTVVADVRTAWVERVKRPTGPLTQTVGVRRAA